MGKLRIVSFEEVIAEKNKGKTHQFKLSDGSGPHRPAPLNRHTGISWETIKKRIGLYGVYSDLIFHVGRIPKELSEPARVEGKKCTAFKVSFNKVGANVQRDGSIETRTGKIIPPNSTMEDNLFPVPDAAEGGWKRDSSESDFFQEQEQPLQTYKTRQTLKRFNDKMERRGFIKTNDFLDKALFSG